MSGETTIRPLRVDDLPTVLAFDRAAGWSHDEAAFRYLLDDAETRGFVAEYDGAMAGFAFAGVREPVGWLGSLAVDPTRQGRGIGTALCLAADAFFREAACDTAILEVAVENRRAIDLYDRLGFVVTGVNDLCVTPPGESPTVPPRDPEGDGAAREVAALTEVELPLLAALDDAYYGGWREQDLLYWVGQGPDLARLVRVEGEPVGYCLAERGTGRLGPAAAPTLPDLLALLDAILPSLSPGAGAAPPAASLRLADPDEVALAALAARNLHPVPALRYVRMEKLYRRPLRRLPGYYSVSQGYVAVP